MGNALGAVTALGLAAVGLYWVFTGRAYNFLKALNGGGGASPPPGAVSTVSGDTLQGIPPWNANIQQGFNPPNTVGGMFFGHNPNALFDNNAPVMQTPNYNPF